MRILDWQLYVWHFLNRKLTDVRTVRADHGDGVGLPNNFWEIHSTTLTRLRLNRSASCSTKKNVPLLDLLLFKVCELNNWNSNPRNWKRHAFFIQLLWGGKSHTPTVRFLKRFIFRHLGTKSYFKISWALWYQRKNMFPLYKQLLWRRQT